MNNEHEDQSLNNGSVSPPQPQQPAAQENQHVAHVAPAHVAPTHQTPQNPSPPAHVAQNVFQQQPQVTQTPMQTAPVLPKGYTTSEATESTPVVKVWSIRGIEYAIMTFMLLAVAIAINWVLVALVTGSTSFLLLSAPLALLIVSLPIFAFLFLRLKKAELMNPSLRLESTKRKFSQLSQMVAFIVNFFAALTIVGSILASIGGESDNLGKRILTSVIFMLVWGGVFAYYWVDEHRQAG